MPDDKFEDIIADDVIRNDVRLRSNKVDPDTEAEILNEGILSASIKSTKRAVDSGRRQFMNTAFYGMLGGAGAFSLKYRNEALSAIGAATGIGSLYYAAMDNNESADDKKKEKFIFDAGLANRLGGLAYNDPKISSIASESGLNAAANAVLSSMHDYKSGNSFNVHKNTAILKRALEATEDETAQHVLLARLLVSYNMLADGDEARSIAKKLVVSRTNNASIQASTLSYLTSLALSSTKSLGYRHFNGTDLDPYIERWRELGIDIHDASHDKHLLHDLGIHLYSIQQLRYFYKCKTLPSRSNTAIELRELRKYMIRDFLENLKYAKDNSNAETIAEDLFGSLQRPAFHAFYSGDLQHTKEILDLYFGRTEKLESSLLTKARETIKHSRGLQRHWMISLDIAVSAQSDKDRAQKKFSTFLRSLHTDGTTPLTRNTSLLRALPELGENIGLNKNQLIESNPAIKQARIPPATLHKAYIDAVGGLSSVYVK